MLSSAWRERFTGLWLDRDFRRLWSAHTTSQFGNQITLIAVPLTAVITLDATALQMGLLTAATRAPFLIIGLPAGVWVDRLRRRPTLITTDIGRCLLLLTIPLLAALDMLRIELLYTIVFLVGMLTVFFDVASQSYLPSLVGRPQLVEANSKLALSNSVAQFAGPGTGGLLVRLVGAPFAIVADALTYLVSGALISGISRHETSPAQRDNSSVWREVRDGVRVVLGDPVLRALAGCTATNNLFFFIVRAVLILYAARELDIGPGLIGLIFAAGSVGSLAGASVASSLGERIGIGPAIIAATLISSGSVLLIPLAQGPLSLTVSLLVAAQILGALGGTLYNINQVSLRQTITPDHLLGRMNATMRFFVWGAIPLGGLLGGLLGEATGLRPTLLIGAAGGPLAVLWLLASPVRQIRELPETTTS